MYAIIQLLLKLLTKDANQAKNDCAKCTIKMNTI